MSWIGFRGPQAGIARVFLDGVLGATVDAWASTEEVGAVLFAGSGFIDGPHTLTVEATGAQNANAVGTYIVVDAFDVTGSGSPPPSDPRDSLMGLDI